MKLGVVLPTYNNGDIWRKLIVRFSESTQWINNIDNVNFLIVYQNVTLQEDIDLMKKCEEKILLQNPTWSVISVSKDFSGHPISMVRIRNSCMMLDTSCDLYLFVDDDVKFNKGAGDHYNDIIRFFKEDPNLGLVMSASHLGGYHYLGKLKYDVDKFWYTNRGLFIRNLHTCEESPVYAKELLECHQGGLEESLAAHEVLYRGLKCATYFNNPTTHKFTYLHNTKKDVTIDPKHRYEEDKIHRISGTKEFMMNRYGVGIELVDDVTSRRISRELYNKYSN